MGTGQKRQRVGFNTDINAYNLIQKIIWGCMRGTNRWGGQRKGSRNDNLYVPVLDSVVELSQ
jgi:hypothetical protein